MNRYGRARTVEDVDSDIRLQRLAYLQAWAQTNTPAEKASRERLNLLLEERFALTHSEQEADPSPG